MSSEFGSEGRLLHELGELRAQVADLQKQLAGRRRWEDTARATEQRCRQLEEELRESADRFRALSEAAFEGVCIHDGGVILEVNHALARMFGYGVTEAAGRSVLEFTAEGSREIVREQVRSGSEEPYEVLGLRKDGTTFRCRLQGCNMMYKGRLVRVTALRDITEDRRAEEELRANEARHRALLRAMPDLIFRLRRDGTVVDYDAPTDQEQGAPTGAFTDKRIDQVLPGSQIERTRRFVELALETGAMQSFEYQLDVPDGERRDYEVRLVVCGPDEVMAIIRDVTQRKRAEERIRDSLEEKELLLSEIHHRVKNNLQVISSLLNLQAHSVTDETTREMFRESQNRVRAMGLTHEQLYQSKELARIDLGQYIRNLTGSLFRAYSVDPGAITLVVDVSAISLGLDTAIPCGLIVNELVSNSLKHAFPKGGRGWIHIHLHPESEDEVSLVVGDNGVGVPEGLDPTTTGSLGLQIVNTLVGQLKGKIRVDASDGTKVRITFRR